jgi:hypothetical protein
MSATSTKKTISTDEPCEYSVEKEGRKTVLVLECLDCERSGHDLNVTECYRGALNAYQKEVNIDVITTSHYIQTHYFGPSVELFGQLSGLRQDLEELSNRDPVADFKAKDPKGKYKSICPTCQANPENIFPELEIVLKKNPREFITFFKKSVSKIPPKDTAKMCTVCKKITVEEMTFAFDSYREMVQNVVKYGFNLNTKGGKK